MGYTVVKSFERGIDTRRMIDTTEPGALLDALDCHVTRGGEIEKRAAFVVIGTFPANTVGMYATFAGGFHTWGSDASPSGPLPAGTTYHSIPDPDGSPLVRILSVEEFNVNLYVIALYEDGDIIHWYNDAALHIFVPPPPPLPGGGGGGGGGTVTPPDGGLAPGMPRVTFYLEDFPDTDPSFFPTTVGIRSAIVYNPGSTDFTTAISCIVTDGTDPDFGIPIDTTPTAIPWDHTHATTAAQLMSQVNDYQATSNVRCTVVGNKVTVWINEVTTAYNGWAFSIGFVDPSSALTFVPLNQTLTTGVFDNPLTFTGGLASTGGSLLRDVTLPTTAFDPTLLNNGTFVLAHNHKLYCVQRSKLNFCGNDAPLRWDTDAFGAGSIDHTMMGEGTPFLVSLADYGGDLAVFAARDIFIWHMDPDPKANFKRQVLHRTGTYAPHSTCAFGESEVMYLDYSGIRSLRSRASVDAAYASDIGNNIDTLVLAKVKAMTSAQLLFNIWSDIEPRSGRLWMALFDKIFVLSYFPSNQIAAWTVYDASELPVDMMNSTGDNLFWRSGNSLVCYGNTTGDEYDDTEGMARFPYVDGGKPATSKNWQGVDLAALGTWQIKASFDPTQPATLDLIANVVKSTYAQQKIAMNGESPAVSLELRTSFVGPARISNAALHYTDSTAD